MNSGHIMDHEQNKFAWRRILYFILCTMISAITAYYTPTKPEQLEKMANIAAAIFSILFGFSMTIIAVVGGLDTILGSFSWESLQKYRDTFSSKILRQSLLCLTYFVSIIASLLVITIEPCSIYYKFLSYFFVFMVSFSFFCSLPMPFSLHRLYCERYEFLMKDKGAPR